MMICRVLDSPDPKVCFKYSEHIHSTRRKFFRALWSWQTAVRSWRYLEYSTWFWASFWQNRTIFSFRPILITSSEDFSVCAMNMCWVFKTYLGIRGIQRTSNHHLWKRRNDFMALKVKIDQFCQNEAPNHIEYSK